MYTIHHANSIRKEERKRVACDSVYKRHVLAFHLKYLSHIVDEIASCDDALEIYQPINLREKKIK